MRKFLSAVFLFAAVCASACQFEEYSVCAMRIPYISHVNGIQVAQVSDTSGGDGTCCIDFAFTEGVSTNLPLTVRVQTAEAASSGFSRPLRRSDFEQYKTTVSGPIFYHWWTTEHIYNGGISAQTGFAPLRLALYYSIDGGSTWTLAAARRYADFLQQSMEGIVFGRDILPITLRTGTTLQLVLVAGSDPDWAYNENSCIRAGGRYLSNRVYGGGNGYGGFEVTVTISGNRRGGF